MQSRSSKVLLSFAIVVVVFVMGVYAYMYYRIQVSTSKTVTALGALHDGPSSANKEQLSLLEYKASLDKWSKLQDFFISPDEEVVFIETIESLGPESGSSVTITSIDSDKFENAVPGTKGKLKAKVSATGSWSSVMRMLSLAEVTPYEVSINNIRLDQYSTSMNDVDSKTKKASKDEWKLSFDIEVLMVVPLAD